ncbi:imidazole glycerol phosphate synthase subunit HisH [Maribacter sp.]|uniref:imidazole glycerol phosphate synthase subunit HisH n=1 Tax=Maribacter sp. TaxID=1897614 RepID=UPI0025BE02A6|nr:imidazole glycerol phosphate synthase subunit HisH [Maribacter sp.]
MTIAIIKYGMGNVASVQKAIKKMGYHSIITDNAYEIEKADVIILPGVGSFKKGMENLIEGGFVELLSKEVLLNKKPFIGICLGMQLIATYGNEPERVKGLDWIKGEVIKIKSDNLRVPHLGWNTITVKNNNKKYKEFNKEDYYFIHSYHFLTENPNDILMTVDYGDSLVAAVQKENIHAMQFHPEKSQEAGIQLIKKILDSYA